VAWEDVVEDTERSNSACEISKNVSRKKMSVSTLFVRGFRQKQQSVVLDLTDLQMILKKRLLNHGYATKEGCRTERKSRNLEYAMGVRLTGFTT
jgi:hypothetical protein